ncbi:hypothetical protein ScPMuIL_006200 [Solemya velum]
MSDPGQGSDVEHFLEDEEAEEQEFHSLNHLAPPFHSGAITMVHSPTTDTLDSVALEPSPTDDYEEVNEDTGALRESTDGGVKKDAESEEQNPHISGDEKLATFSIEGTNVEKEVTDTPNASSYFTAGEESLLNDTLGHQPQLSSYFAQPIAKDPVAESFFDSILVDDGEYLPGGEMDEQITSDKLVQDEEEEKVDEDNKEEKTESVGVDIKQMAANNYQKIRSLSQGSGRTSLPEHIEPETVAFEGESSREMSESKPVPLPEMDEKDDFESFTAEGLNDNEIDLTNMSLSVSPSHKLLTEKLMHMHLTENIPFSLAENEEQSLDEKRHTSSSSGDGDRLDQHAPPAHHFYQPPTPLSPISTPVHQPKFSASQLSPLNTPTHQLSVHTDIPANPGDPKTDFPYFSAGEPTVTRPNNQPGVVSDVFKDVSDDPFTSSLHMSDLDRRQDAWIPSDATRHIILTVLTSAPGMYEVLIEQLSTPGLYLDEPQGDPVRELVQRYMGEQESQKRHVPNPDSVSQDIGGLTKLVEAGCWRSAVDLSGYLLSDAGQGIESVGQVTKHTPHSLQLWFLRLALLVKLRLYSVAESELAPFQNLDTPDLYYEYYPHTYPGRKGSLVPFGMRLLHAELPHYLGRTTESLDKLYYVLAVTQKILKNLEDELAEDGSAMEISTESRKASTELWLEREKQVLYIIGNNLLSLRDYEAALSVYGELVERDPQQKTQLVSGMGRIFLQMGNVQKAEECFKNVETLAEQRKEDITCLASVNKGLVYMCTNEFTEAHQCFHTAVNKDPSNASAVNNMAVCSLYLGHLKDALATLETLVHGDPERNLQEGVLFNLCTLYELESSRAMHKKQALLDLVSKYKGDGFPVACLKMS